LIGGVVRIDGMRHGKSLCVKRKHNWWL